MTFFSAITCGSPIDRAALELDASLDQRTFLDGKRIRFGQPLIVHEDLATRLRRFASAYHRAIEAIVRAWAQDEEVRVAVPVHPRLSADALADEDPLNGRVHLCRLDLYLTHRGGGFQVLETNANCPGALVDSAHAARLWRGHLERAGVHLPPALPQENPEWMAAWFLAVIEEETGTRPSYVPILRKDGEVDTELSDQVVAFRTLGIDSQEIDPRRLALGPDGRCEVSGRPFDAAYLKFRIPLFCEERARLSALVKAVLRRRLFVQNGLRGRWVGDNKLCLALLSDPQYRHLFDATDYELIRPHIPWSRSLSRCNSAEILAIMSNRADYVLKRPCDTQGRGVVVGREAEAPGRWGASVRRAKAEGWLVQAYIAPTSLVVDGTIPMRHDLAIGLVNGHLEAAFSRTSSEYRVNLARSGRLHPVFVA